MKTQVGIIGSGTAGLLQCALDDDLAEWPDERFWDELRRRLPEDLAQALVTGPAIDSDQPSGSASVSRVCLRLLLASYRLVLRHLLNLVHKRPAVWQFATHDPRRVGATHASPLHPYQKIYV